MTGEADVHASLALKLSPKLGLLLQAWLAPNATLSVAAPPRLVSVWSKHFAQSNTWYHIAVNCVGGLLQLYVNGQLEATEQFDGVLALPPRPSDGDVRPSIEARIALRVPGS